jgi:hypothetical protein
LLKEIIAVYAENHTKHIIENADLMNFKATGAKACRYHWALKG